MIRLALLLTLLPTLALADVTGRARVIDGDTLEVAGERVRLHGIDAPELGQTCWDARGEFPCGRRGKRLVAKRSWGQVLFAACLPSSEDRGRVLHVAWRCAVGGLGLEVSTSRPDPERRHHPDPAGGAGRRSFTAAPARASPTRGRDGEDPMARPGRAGAAENDAMVTPGRFSAFRPLEPAAGGKSRLFGPIRPPSRPLSPHRCVPFATPGRRLPGGIFAIIRASAHPSRGPHRRWAAGREGPPWDPGGRLADARMII